MTIDPKLPSPGESDDFQPDNTVELSLDEAGALDLQAFADEIAEVAIEETESLADGDGPPSLQRLLELEKMDAEHRDKHHRLMADFANYRNRTVREIQMATDQAERKMLLELLPVMDSFERCLEATYSDLESFQAGVMLIQKQFQDALRRIGVKPADLDPGDPFDARMAEALTTTADPTKPDGVVVTVYEKGYFLRTSLIRPARVVVNYLEGHVDQGSSGSASQGPEA